MKQLSERALQFIEKSGRNKEYKIDTQIIEEHLKLYNLQDTSHIIRFHEMYSGLNLQNIVIHIFTSKQIKDYKKVNTYYFQNKTLISVNEAFYISENGEIAFKDFPSRPYDIIFYFDSFDTFVEQQAFLEENQHYMHLPGLGNELIYDIDLLPDYFANYEFITECSDKYHRFWKNDVNLIRARLYPEGWSLYFDGLSEDERHNLIEKLITEKIII